jgi:hypothetical protein
VIVYAEEQPEHTFDKTINWEYFVFFVFASISFLVINFVSYDTVACAKKVIKMLLM